MTSDLLGYDLDGTLCDTGPMREKSYHQQTSEERREYDEALQVHYQTARVLRRPKGPFVIITGRQEKFRPETEMWLASNNIHPCALEMMSTTPSIRHMVEHKVHWCRHYGVSVYYEDDPHIAAGMKALGINVIKV